MTLNTDLIPSGLLNQLRPNGMEPQGGVGATVSVAELGQSVARFESALSAAMPAGSEGVTRVAQIPVASDALPLPPASGVGAVDGAQSDLSATGRAARGLELEGAREVTTGQTILDGIGRLRSIFDSQNNTVAHVTSREPMHAVSLMELQTEVVRYTVLVDVSSKLAGKSTQALDSLMKGQ